MQRRPQVRPKGPMGQKKGASPTINTNEKGQFAEMERQEEADAAAAEAERKKRERLSDYAKRGY